MKASKNEIYDNIGEKYDEYINTAANRPVDINTIFKMAGDIKGKKVLDLACGLGNYCRLAIERGAESAVGVDISPEMIRVASENYPTKNITYFVSDVADMKKIGDFDLVSAVWLLNYASSEEVLTRMFKTVFENLKPGGKLVAKTINPDFVLEKGNFTKYGCKVVDETPVKDGFFCNGEFMTTPPTPFTFYRLKKEVYERSIKSAGFRDYYWQSPLIPNESIDSREDGFWELFRKNSLQIGLCCLK